MRRIPVSVAPIATLLFVLFSGRAVATEVSPVGPGRFPVGSTNLEVTARAGVPMVDFLKGKTTRKETFYIADILTHPESAIVTSLAVPPDAATFGRQAGTKLPLVLYVLYPTTPDNPRPNYTFPYKETGDNVFPHMQRAGEKPLLANDGTKYPLIVYSTGYEGHGLWDLQQLKALASHGFIVVDIFHSDGRGVSFDGNAALRPLEFKQALDAILAHPDFASVIDPDRIGACGSSFGGYTILRVMGGANPSRRLPARADPRIKAGFGLVPFMGGQMGPWPLGFDAWYFEKDYSGLGSVRTPFLAVYGQKDRNVKPESVEAGVGQMSGPAAAIMLDGEEHLLSKAVWSDVTTWQVLFFDAWLRDSADAKRQLAEGTSVRGGVNDHRTLQHGAR
jgi:predicted dienelactone hydrolase